MALLWSPANNGSSSQNDSSCSRATDESTVLQDAIFGGIPVVLLLDFVAFLVLLLIFSFIRKKVWDYGRLALVSESKGLRGKTHLYSRTSSNMSTIEEYDMGFCSWLPFVLRMDKEMIEERCGIDAVHYLSFQRHLIVLLVIICVGSVGVVLPLNMSGNLMGDDPKNFGRTTIGNLQKDNDLLWLHTMFAVLYLIVTVVVLRHHTSQMKDFHKKTAKTTLLVCSLPREASADQIKTHFSEAYPTCRVLQVNLCYDAAKLIAHARERERLQRNLQYYQKVLEREGRRESISPHPCGYLCCCCCCEVVDAIDYYSSQESSMKQAEEHLREEVPQRPLGMAFVTLETESMATYILRDFNALDCVGDGAAGRASRCGCGRQPQPSSDSAALRVTSWRLSYAPRPSNIYWENLSVVGARWWLRCLFLNFFLFILLFFLTTPSIIITTIDKFNVTRPIYYLNNAIISQFLPTLLLWCFSALLPTLVYYSTLGEAHWTRSGENMSMMHKLYMFLLFMVLILPSLGLTSLDVFFEWLFDNQFFSQGKLRFECVFLPNQGAFFVNYVIAAALIGSGMELLRLPGLVLYTVRMALAHSAAERRYIKQNQAYEFEYGAMYGWMLCIFTVIMAYSITCPLIVPFGLLYMFLKYLVDKHNLYFAYLPACLDRRVHMAAVNQALAAPIICLLWLYFFSVIRAGFMAYTSLFTFAILIVTIVICIGYTCFGHFKYLSPHSYKIKEPGDDPGDEAPVIPTDSVYLPKVLQDSLPSEPLPSDPVQRSYGALESSSHGADLQGVSPT
ncbi:CSC1-like protein 1 [Brienomyrus brachyistius]|uniref:CSC1-like protein 1 n=1 Tax=Brienomyrus brachyistius TaxID=42636 RepID=UPI0020B45DD8|nr:CSC1-like protein 1 [Brienomyrus brachyistius]XP_048841905.1 CSC1-like protein 1 [Brienomyrus brachyistius]